MDDPLEELRWHKNVESMSPDERDEYLDDLIYQTKKAHVQYADDVNKCLVACSKRLAGLQKPKFACPEWLKGYSPKIWCDDIVVSGDWLNNRLIPLITKERENFPEAIRDMIAGNRDCETFFIPKAKYERIFTQSIRKGASVSGPGVACLNWWMEIHVMAIAKIHMTSGTVNVRYNTSFTEYLSCSYGNLGKVYAEPEFWESHYVFYTPLPALISAARGGVDGKGVEVVDRDPPWTTYKVDNFSELVPINDDFAKFIRDITINQKLGQALLSRKIIDEQGAALVDQQIQRLSKPEAPAAISQKSVEPGNEAGDDYSMLVAALTGLGFPKGKAVEAAKYVCGKFPQETLEDKIKIALQYPSQ